MDKEIKAAWIIAFSAILAALIGRQVIRLNQAPIVDPVVKTENR